MTKDTIPQDFSLGLALFDALPVILFGMGTWLLWKMTGNVIVLAGAVICFLSGMLKVLWKIIVVIRRKNVWPLFIQMRIGMPAGFVRQAFYILNGGLTIANLAVSLYDEEGIIQTPNGGTGRP